MRASIPAIAALSTMALIGCTAPPDRLAGEARPAGGSTPTAPTASVPAAAAVSASPGITGSAGPRGRSASPSAPASSATGGTSLIRATDWPNVKLEGLGFLDIGDVRFRNGTASSGANNCTMLPGDARPVYAEFLTEEPADSPVTEDGLVLVECGSDGMDQALILVRISYDQKKRQAAAFIKADPATAPGKRMTFLSYAVDRGMIVTTVRKADGSRETRRYAYRGVSGWERV